MTIGTTISTILLPCDGVNTQFDYPFLIPFASSAVIAYFAPGSTTIVVLPGGTYSVSGIGNPSGGVVTYPLSGSPLAAGSFFVVSRLLPMVQAVSLASQGPTFAAIEQGLDYQMMISQQLQTFVNALQAEITGIVASTASAAVQQVQSLPTIAALRAFSGPPTLPVWVAGYYSTADGGEGWFGYNPLDSTSPDNGGTIIVDGLGRRWDRALQGQPPVLKQFGAKGDATTDDTAAIQAALNLATHIRATAGIYRVQPLTMPAGSWLEGDGPGDALMLPVTGTEKLLSNSSYSASVGNFAVSGLGFLGSNSAPKGVAISMSGSSATTMLTNVRVENCNFSGFTTSVNAQYCQASQFLNLYSDTCTSPYINNASNAVVWDGCIANNTVGGPGNTGYAFLVENALLNGGVQLRGCQSINQAGGILGSSAPRVVVDGFQSFSASLNGVLLSGCSNWVISGAELLPLSPAVTGFFCETTSTNITITGCNVSGADFGIFAGGTGIAVSGNVLQNNIVDIAIGGTGSSRVNVSGNICRSATATSIWELTGADYTLAIGNQVVGAILLVGAHSSSTSYNATIT